MYADSAPSTQDRGPTALLSSTSSDAHTWNLIYLQLLAEELGYRVTNLGACVPDEYLLARCRRLEPDLVILSSVNGHGHHDGLRIITPLRRLVARPGAAVVIGGKLGICGPDPDRVRSLLAAGFDAVFDDDAGIAAFRSFVRTRALAVVG